MMVMLIVDFLVLWFVMVTRNGANCGVDSLVLVVLESDDVDGGASGGSGGNGADGDGGTSRYGVKGGGRGDGVGG